MSRGARGLPPELIERIRKQYGFDKPAGERFLLMMRDYLVFDLGESFFRNARVTDLVFSKMPVSISLGLWTTLLVYMISIPLGVAKAVRDGSRFDIASSSVVIVGNAIPSFLFALLLVVLFAGGSFWKVFPLRGIVSDDWRELSWPALIADYAWHMVLPVAAMVVGGFATLTMLTKNSFLEEIGKQYVLTARAKGAGRAARALRPRLSQRHADRHRRLPGRLHRGAVHRLAADRGDLLARRHGTAGLRSRDQPRLSGDVRHPVDARPALPGGRPDRRPDVHAGRPAN
jgi:ABC-type microcin C transport system permease subunit YejB